MDFDQIILGKLNEQQKIAVESTNGPLLVFAGAGSGKTRVITNRIAYLITKEGVSPNNILAVTFTKKAAGEMQERVVSLLKELGVNNQDIPSIGTFHSIGALLLRHNAKKLGLLPNFSIYDSDDSDNLVKEILIEKDIDIKQIRPKSISFFISAAKNELISPDKFPQHYGGYIEDIVSDIYPLYQKQLQAQNAVDFGDLIYLTVKLFSENKDVLSYYQDTFKYILIDEYQDTNTAQYMFAKLLSEKYQNICVVGDDDQGIYGWRGADIKNIQSFEKDFKNVKVVKLEQNYRSSGNVISAAMSVIQQNEGRVDKKLWTDKESGNSIVVYQAHDQDDEANYIVDEINRMRRQGYPLTDIAVLYRTNYQSRAIEEAMLKGALPYKLVGGFRFYDRKEIKDILSYLRFIFNPKDDLSISRILNVPNRKIGPKSAAILHSNAKTCGCSVGELLIGCYEISNGGKHYLDINPTVYKKIEEFFPQMGKFLSIISLFGSIYSDTRGMDVLSVIDLIVRKIKYIEYIDDKTEEAEYKKENIEELKSVASSYSLKYKEKSLDMFLQEINLIEQEQNKNQDGSGNYVNLMTLHSSKGLEFNYVFIVGVEEGILPHSRSFTDENELEEERRLCYVGITRAKEKLYLTFAQQRLTREGYSTQIPSRFLGEIPQNICEYYSWDS
ncbi:MAG TPA: UvrD-helicase domain-containing protein [Candidatus Dojkabacteria bacterium]|nr:UvrD-helicase domain-containing protein [Candidatus Dojkabacteria bacterium]